MTSLQQLEQRLQQQALVASFGVFALGEDGLDAIFREACRTAAEGLGCRFAKVLQFMPLENEFLLREGVGWEPGVVGNTRLGGDLASPAGFAFHTGQPVISNHLASESRFRTPAVLAAHGIRRAINVLISAEQRPFGVLEADSIESGDFTVHDIAFIQALANTLAAIVDRFSRQQTQRNSDAFARSVLEASPDCICVLDPTGTVLLMNANGLSLMEIDSPQSVIGTAWFDLWPDDHRPHLRELVASGAAGTINRFETFCPTAAGTPRWWDVVLAPVTGIAGGAERLVAISRDITDRVAANAAKDALLRDKDLLMQEVHHRVKNSLQLVQNLLSLQARSATDPAIVGQLTESAARVHTIAAIHDRLYRGGTSLDVEVGPYLDSLIKDLREGMVSTVQEREIALVADAATWPAAQVSTLGLVLTELVTNAVKYGSGRITATFRDPQGDHATLVVEDEGTALPADFDPTRYRGLGMRLVNGLVRGAGSGLEVDRSVSHTRFVVRLPQPMQVAAPPNRA